MQESVWELEEEEKEEYWEYRFWVALERDGCSVLNRWSRRRGVVQSLTRSRDVGAWDVLDRVTGARQRGAVLVPTEEDFNNDLFSQFGDHEALDAAPPPCLTSARSGYCASISVASAPNQSASCSKTSRAFRSHSNGAVPGSLAKLTPKQSLLLSRRLPKRRLPQRISRCRRCFDPLTWCGASAMPDAWPGSLLLSTQ